MSLLPYEDATPDDLRKLIRFIDDMNPQGHVLKEIQRWVSGDPEFADMNSMLSHFTAMADKSEDSVI